MILITKQYKNWQEKQIGSPWILYHIEHNPLQNGAAVIAKTACHIRQAVLSVYSIIPT